MVIMRYYLSQKNNLLIPSVGPTSFPTPGAVNLSPISSIKSFVIDKPNPVPIPFGFLYSNLCIYYLI